MQKKIRGSKKEPRVAYEGVATLQDGRASIMCSNLQSIDLAASLDCAGAGCDQTVDRGADSGRAGANRSSGSGPARSRAGRNENCSIELRGNAAA